MHAKYGGIVPEIAARAHIEQIAPIIETTLSQAGVSYRDLSAVAVTDGPGLSGSLLIGLTAAKSLALAYDLPLVAVDHLHAHAVSAALTSDVDPFPAVALVVSGGHTSLFHVPDVNAIELMGQTTDDAAGEAFDKVASILELGYPGGPVIDRIAQEGDPTAIDFPRTWLHEPYFNFSYSGLKTAVLYHVYGRGEKYGSVAHLSRREIADVAASFQAALVEPLVKKTVQAAHAKGVKSVVVGGGVAANSALRRSLADACATQGLQLHLTPLEYCTDNAAMVAFLGYHAWRRGATADLHLEARSGLVRPERKRPRRRR